MQAFKNHYITREGISLHSIEYPNTNAPLLLMHGLSANALAFNGLIEAGLTNKWHVYSIDFRGRGQSGKRAFAFSVKHHAQDVITQMDDWGIEQIVACGHSFGGLIGSYLAYHYPKRISKLILLDVAPALNPKAAQMLMPALSRIDKKYTNFDAYIEALKKAEYMHFWDDAMLPYYKADVNTDPLGRVECISDIADIMQISSAVAMEPWSMYFKNLKQQAMLIVATKNYTMDEPLLPVHMAKATHATMLKCIYKEANGNHQTMLFGAGATELVKYIGEMA